MTSQDPKKVLLEYRWTKVACAGAIGSRTLAEYLGVISGTVELHLYNKTGFKTALEMTKEWDESQNRQYFIHVPERFKATKTYADRVSELDDVLNDDGSHMFVIEFYSNDSSAHEEIMKLDKVDMYIFCGHFSLLHPQEADQRKIADRVISLGKQWDGGANDYMLVFLTDTEEERSEEDLEKEARLVAEIFYTRDEDSLSEFEVYTNDAD